MNNPAAHFVPPRRIDIYEPFQQMGTWDENLKAIDDSVVPDSLIVDVDMKYDNQSEDTSHGTPPNKYDRQATNPFDKIQRRLAQNREAARKCRLRKKAYVQLLETSRLKLMQIEKELERAKQQGAYAGGGAESSHTGFSGSVNNTGVAAFELGYGRWIEEQDRQIRELRNALQAQVNDVELRVLVENGMSHYSALFRMKENAANTDAFYVMSGLWRTPSERFFLWIGGFCPSEILKIVMPTVDTLTAHQLAEICKLRQSCQQAEEALSLGLEKLQQNVSDAVAGENLGKGNYITQVATAMEKLKALTSFLNQADHIRQEALKQMARILTTRQTALGLMALGEYFQRLRKLSLLWSDRPSKTT